MYSPLRLLISMWLLILMEMSRQYASLIRFLKGMIISVPISSLMLSYPSVMAIKRIPSIGNIFSM